MALRAGQPGDWAVIVLRFELAAGAFAAEHPNAVRLPRFGHIDRLHER
jgi:hypothetical protein